MFAVFLSSMKIQMGGFMESNYLIATHAIEKAVFSQNESL